MKIPTEKKARNLSTVTSFCFKVVLFNGKIGLLLKVILRSQLLYGCTFIYLRTLEKAKHRRQKYIFVFNGLDSNQYLGT